MRLGRPGRALWSFATISALAAALLLGNSPVAASGTVTSCGSDSQLSSRLGGGGTITFNCGTKTILLGSGKTITHDTVIDGGGKITFSGGGTLQLFHVNGGVTLTLKNIVLKNGHSSGNGGAIENDGTLNLDHAAIDTSTAPDTNSGGAIYTTGTLTAKHTTFDHDTAGDGGAILAFDNTHVTIKDSALTYDKATGTDSSGGAISTGEGVTLKVTNTQFRYDDANGYGGAIQNSYQSTPVTITGSWFHQDQASLAGGAVYSEGSLTIQSSTFDTNGASHGGAVWSTGNLTATNMTAWSNSADEGGALYVSGTATLFNVTLSGNTAGAPNAPGTGGNIFELGGGSLTLYSVLSVHAFQSDNCTFLGSVTRYFNLSTDNTCGFGAGRDHVAVTLGGLETNGGPVPTMRLPKGSLAINDGDTGAACAGTDARGVTRPRGGGCDAGAYEYRPCTGKPAAPSALTADPGAPAPTYQNVVLDWVGADCTAKYNVVVRYHSPTGHIYFSQKNLKESSVTTSPLATGYTWYWQVTACNAKGCVAGPWKKFRTTTS